MMFKVVLNIFFSIFHFFLRIFKRALCCLKRRRRPSCEPLPLTNIGVVPNNEKVQDIQSWNSWDEMPTIVTDYSSKPVDPIQQKIEQYREQIKAAAVEAPDSQENVDFFQDMTPRIVKQKKLILQKETDDSQTKSNLSLAPDPTFHCLELGVWDDSQSWEDQTEQDWDANEVLREKKRFDREQRLAEQLKKKGDKDIRSGRSMVATKIS